MPNHGASTVVNVPISVLRPGESPRLGGLNYGHAHALSKVDPNLLPPLIVTRSTMRVIDGMHRLTAAGLAGRDKIDVRYFDGTDDEAFLIAVTTNVTHGLPLTLEDRRAAAQRIVRTHPELSDRSIASATGLAAKTVAAVRLSQGANSSRSDVRIGRDGRTRPLNSAEGRRVAGAMIAAHPEASVREIAKVAGISVGTAQDVRKRLRVGGDPTAVLPRRGPDGTLTAPLSVNAPPATDQAESRQILEGLRRDPSLRYTENGRRLLRLLSSHEVVATEWQCVVNGIPPHCALLVSRVARSRAAAWTDLADELERSAHDCA
jgi:hypothetical protein